MNPLELGNTLRIRSRCRSPEGVLTDPHGGLVFTVTNPVGENAVLEARRLETGVYEAEYYPPSAGTYTLVSEASPGPQGPPAAKATTHFMVL